MGLDPEGGHCRGFSPCRGAGGECDEPVVGKDFNSCGEKDLSQMPCGSLGRILFSTIIHSLNKQEKWKAFHLP